MQPSKQKSQIRSVFRSATSERASSILRKVTNPLARIGSS